jgi:GalNAc-alpha-(1->4)-GalNAc-alpha-(1->3)-diNAcBac-PP-undecaprenol alpha-1,4-N-acetyl-D-galactosaminyltransferase
MKLALVISSLAMGGAERVITHLATGWANLGIEVHLITLANQDTDFYTLPPSIHRICLNHMKNSANPVQAIHNNLNRVIALRKQLKLLQPKAVVSFMDATNVLVVLANMGLGITTIISERTNPARYQQHLGLIWDNLRKITYPKAAAVVAVSKAAAKQLTSFIPQSQVEVIPNPVLCNGTNKISTLQLTSPTVISMGRLVALKNFDMLIQAFAECLNLHPEWQLVIMGDGPQRGDLESLINELGVAKHVRLLGAVKDPAPILAQSEIFTLYSSFEGFSNSLVEAMACKLPVICTQEAGGELINNGKQGYLVPDGDAKALADSISHLMDDHQLREQMGFEANLSVKKYKLPRVINQWNLLLSKVTNIDWPIMQ